MIDFRIQPPGFEQGIYNIPFSRYVRIPALNSSKLKHLRKTPAHFKAALEAPPEYIAPAKQRMFDMGKAFDCYILDGGRPELERRVAVEPDINKNTNDYKNWKKANLGKIILNAREKEKVIEMAMAAFRKKCFSDIFSNGTPHVVMVWKDTRTGLWCKAELDWITNDGVLADLKSTADASYWFFRRNAYRLGYINQAAFYLEGLTTITGLVHERSLLASVEKDEPFESQIFRLNRSVLMEAADENAERMERLLNCLATDDWPGYPDQIMDLESGFYEDPELTEEEQEEETYGF